MAEQKDRKNPGQKRHQRKPVMKQVLTPEEQEALKAAIEKAAADKKAEQERIADWEKRVEKMTPNQLRSEVKRIIRHEHVKVGKGIYDPKPGFTIAFATVFDTILETTNSRENPKGRLSAYPR